MRIAKIIGYTLILSLFFGTLLFVVALLDDVLQYGI